MKQTCKDCAFRAVETESSEKVLVGECQNPNLVEEFGDKGAQSEMLIYSYGEGGGFWVGPNFGCVHFEARASLTR